ncbi:MAG TPA: alpha/beta hydrolase [Acidimicrobiales bacterium]|nr:alpha/beta hydrolase [Acidimicrobiales bacterium]
MIRRPAALAAAALYGALSITAGAMPAGAIAAGAVPAGAMAAGAMAAGAGSPVAGAATGRLGAAGRLGATGAAPAIRWSPCDGQAGYRCGTVRVPVDYRHPGGPSVAVAVIEKPAADPVGSPGVLLFNPGGPGESGVQILPVLASLVPAEVADRFDLVSFDERGTGASERLDCGPAPATAASVVPLPAGTGGPLPAAAAYRGMAGQCRRRYPALFGEVDTTNAARDMDRLRQALGVATIDYWGLSYGTVLGSTYARLFPGRVRAMVLDGAVDADQSLTAQATQEAPAIQRSLDHFFDTCAADPDCPLGADPSAYYQRVATALADHPLPAPDGGDPGSTDGVPVTVGDLYAATLFYLTVPAFGGAFPTAVAAAAGGDGGPLRSLSLAFEQDLDGTSLVGPQWTYACNDADQRPSPVRAGRLARSLSARYGGIGGYAVTYDLGACTAWPAATDPVGGVRVHGGPPILVVGNTGDPNTPHAAAVALARDLGSGHLVTWDGWGHTWLLNGSSDGCMQAVVDAYLATLTVPAAGTTCG